MLFKEFYRLKSLERYDKIYPLIHIITEDNKLVFEKLKNNICGGLSLVFHRYHERDVTYIQRCKYINGKWELDLKGNLVKNIVPFDANALYLWCLGQNMPCGKLQYIPKSEVDLSTIFGFIEVDIIVPEQLYNYFSEFPPIVKNIEYSNNICGEYTTTLLNNKFSKSRKLIATLKGEKLLIKSTRLKWLVEHGCIITKIYGVIEAIPRKIFANFMNWVSDERRKGVIDQKYAIIAECCKTIGNSSFGRTIMDKNKHKDIKYGDETKFNKCKIKFTFYNSDKYENVYEIVLNKESIK